MAPSTFEAQLNSRLSMTASQPYMPTFDALNEVARSLEVWLKSPSATHSATVQVEPGFPAELGQQFNVVVHIPDRHVSDTLFRAYVSPDGKAALDLFGEQPLYVAGKSELQDEVLKFIDRPEVKSRLMIYKKLTE